MTLKYEIDKESFDGLDDSVKGFYAESDNGYKLEIDGLEDTGALKRAKDHEKEARKVAETENKTLKEKLELLEKDRNRGNSDYEALEASFNEKLEGKTKELESQFEPVKAENDLLKSQLQKVMVTEKAQGLAAGIAISAESTPLVAEQISKRLQVQQLESGDFKTVVLKNGKPSAMSVNDLIDELKTNEGIKPLLKGSNASGGGATGGDKSKGGGATNGQMTTAERIAARKAARQ